MRSPLSWVKKAVGEGKGSAPGTQRGSRRYSQKAPPHRDAGTSARMGGSRGQAGMGDHVTSQQTTLTGQAGRTEPLLSPGRCPISFLLVPYLLCLGEQAGETEAAGPSRLVTRQTQQTAAAEGILKTLDPTLITCQAARPDAAQKLWNKRAISYYF